MVEQTLSIIKPDSVRGQNIGNIVSLYEQAGLTVNNMKMLKLTQAQAESFYAIHSERPFFNDLVSFMISGPVVAIELEGDNAVLKHREIMGATNPAEADEGTIRKLYGASIDNNAVHGSDSLENAKIEIEFFFAS
ncbi:nucleoside-diphosphate kinase [Candidatus Comchoanobacter bicostacola]|uniref:Nucleoside diphosphate kinase n=1 Tax=Candidatus Comchoanobacter bicostacola TaxID=2919598 RepID=A0ABY5DIN3_9GAMM|nr:nucleoside-diphosphate kinase [Candidatus Comchoanobacter bicostacola]UTC24140.1 nucleoside-diphosphate kinase [Candidatus Comchoanobacter bicostacola]